MAGLLSKIKGVHKLPFSISKEQICLLHDVADKPRKDRILRDRGLIETLLNLPEGKIPQKNGKLLICGIVRRCILQNQQSIVVNFKINEHGKPDDDLLLEFPILQLICPRSLSVAIFFQSGSTDIVELISRTQNFNKFFAKQGAEDDDALALANKNGELENPLNPINHDASGVLRAVLTAKANGKQMTINGTILNGDVYVIGGSKNTHYTYKLCATLAEQMEQIKSIKDDEICYSIFTLFFEHWFSMTPEQQTILKDIWMAGYSLAGELEDGAHMTCTPSGKEQLTFFGIVKSSFENANADGEQEKSLCVEITEALEILKSLGFNTVYHKIIETPEELSETRTNARFMSGSEGIVFHYQKLSVSADGKQIWITYAFEKFKTFWYVFLRMWRELLTRLHKEHEKEPVTLEIVLQKLNKCIDDRDRGWMCLPEIFKVFWKNLLGESSTWFFKNAIPVERLSFLKGKNCGMATIWKEFLGLFPDKDNFLSMPMLTEDVKRAMFDEYNKKLSVWMAETAKKEAQKKDSRAPEAKAKAKAQAKAQKNAEKSPDSDLKELKRVTGALGALRLGKGKYLVFTEAEKAIEFAKLESKIAELNKAISGHSDSVSQVPPEQHICASANGCYKCT